MFFLKFNRILISGGLEFPPELPTDRGPPVRRLPLPAAHLLPADPQHHLPGGHHDSRGGQAPVLPGGPGLVFSTTIGRQVYNLAGDSSLLLKRTNGSSLAPRWFCMA